MEKFLKDNFSTAGSGLAQCAEIVKKNYDRSGTVYDMSDELENLSQIRKSSLKELKGKFTDNEWKYLADSFNGITVTPQFRCLPEGNISDCSFTSPVLINSLLGICLFVSISSLRGMTYNVMGCNILLAIYFLLFFEFYLLGLQI